MFDDCHDDIFSPVHNLEQKSIQEGYKDGRKDGLAAGVIEGRDLGALKGYEIGMEVGFYSGCVHMWRQLQAKDVTIIPDRAAKGLAALEDLLADIPLHDPTDERLQELLENVQGRFKAVASMMGCLQDYFPREKGSVVQNVGPNSSASTSTDLSF